jgi:protein-S-isoprenylcysteine O-methyltransferase Ste14
MSIFTIMYWAGVILQVVIRAPFAIAVKSKPKTVHHVSTTEKVLLALLSVVYGLIPLLYTATSWLDFADYHLPIWMGWLGGLVLAASLLVFWRAHIDLKTNWSSSLEIHQDHTLVTTGIYHYIRHPMYASLLLWCIAQIFLIQNWLAGPLGLIFFIPFYTLRVQAEEKMMLDTFGSLYGEYMKKVGGMFPKFSTPHA